MAPKTRTAGPPLLARTGDLGIILTFLLPLLLATSPTVNAQTREGSLTLNVGEAYPPVAVIDEANGYAYFGTSSSPGQVVKIRLSDFTRVDAIRLEGGGEDNLYSGAIDTANGFAYFGTNTFPGRVVKVRLSDFTRVGGLTLNAGEDALFSAVVDAANGFAYFGTLTYPGRIVKVRLSDLTRVEAITLNPGEDYLRSAIIDTANGYAYFGTSSSPGQVVKIRLSDFSRVGALSLKFVENNLWTAVIDAANGFAYFGSNSYPSPVVVKVRLSDFTRVDALTLNPDKPYLSAVVDAAKGYAYFGTASSPGKVVRVRLSDFTQVGALTLNAGENDLWAAVIDAANGYAYFGTYTNPGIIVKVGLAAHDVAVTSISPSPPSVVEGEAVTISVVLENQGSFPETFQLTLRAGGITVGTRSVTMASEASGIESFTWNTVGVASGSYGLSATAGPVPGELDTDDNTRTEGTINVVNQPPMLVYIGPKMVDEEATLAFTATANDPDSGQTLTFSLGQGAPAGAVITNGGVFAWTPTEAQGPNTYTVRVIVTDNLDGSDFEDITITVNEVNVAPVLTTIGARTVSELTLLTFTATATDSDITVQTLTFTVSTTPTGTFPTGATMTTVGVFSWTPTEVQGTGTFVVRVTVSDGSLTDFEDVTITVNEVNVAPVLPAIGSKVVDEETLLIFTATATDPDLPADTLTFSLGPGAPPGASITSEGVFTWTPARDQAPGPYTLTIIVSDGETTASEIITITVNRLERTPPAPVPWWQQYWYLVLIGVAGIAMSAVLVVRKLQGEEGQAQSA